jgi:ribosomal protein S1
VPADAFKIGQEITTKVVDFNLDEKKISLSIKDIELDKIEAEKAENNESSDEATSDTVYSTDDAEETTTEE